MKRFLLPLLIVMGTIALAQDVKPQWNNILGGSSETSENRMVSSSKSGIAITALAKPNAAGFVSGAGDYEYGSSCTLTATPFENYQFVKWTKDGITVSNDASYTFKVTEPSTYVALFCSIESSDVTIGSGISTNAYLPTYTYYKYSFTEQIYLADEIGEAGVITEVSFKVSNSKSATRNVDVYMKSTAKTDFSSKKDWEVFSLSDRVYSGDVTFNASDWTTITLSTPFVFDGESNLVIGVDDNTGSYVSSSSNSPKFYVYATGANRALRIYGDNTDYSPVAPGGYSGSYITSNDQLMFAMHSMGDDINKYTVTAEADPEEAGVVTGAGTYEEGSTVILTATANEGYYFVNWTQDDVEVSTDPVYMFTVTADASYVANYDRIIVPSYDITVATVSNGTITVDKTDATAGETVTLTAIPDMGCYFSHWIVYETGDINRMIGVTDDSFIMPEAHVTVAALFVSNSGSITTTDITIGSGHSTNSYLPTYSYYKYSFTEQIYTAAEIGQAGTITAIAFKVSNSKSSTRNIDLYLQHTNKTVFTNRTNWEQLSSSNKVYSGEVTFNASGWTVITLNTPFVYDGTSNLLIGMDDNTGSYVSGSSNSPKFLVYATGASRAMRIYSDNTNYNPTSSTLYYGTTLTSSNQIQLTMTTIDGNSTSGETLFVTPNVLSDFTYSYGNGPSDVQSFAVVGANLSEAITLTAPSNYEISMNANGPYSGTLALTGERNRGVDTLRWDFEGTMDGWTTIDADGDGYNWQLSSVLMAGYLLDPHSGEDMLSSESYHSATSTPLNPDNWLVSPQVYLDGTFMMFACAQDTSFPAEHFGVYVSTTSNTDVASFVKLDEWTLSYGNTRESSPWFVYAVDLSAYAGQMGYIAVRHFNCYDQFYLNVDDFMLIYDTTPVIPEPIPVHIDYLATNVYVRLKAGLNPGSYNQAVTVTSGSVSTTVALNGLVGGRSRMDSTPEIEIVKTIRLYPNPVEYGRSIHVAVPDDVDMNKARVEIYNEVGVLVHTEIFTGQAIDNNLAAGLYTVRIVETNGNAHYSKLIVK